MHALTWNLRLMLVFMFSSVVSPSSGVNDPGFVDHDISEWNPENQNVELTEAVVNGLAATRIKKHINVSPKTQIVPFQFYSYVTSFLRKYVQGLNTVRIATIIIHYKPHSDHCKGTVTYALVDKRSSDTMTTSKTVNKNGQLMVEKNMLGENKKNVIKGKIHQMVDIKCDHEAIVQFSMNYFVTVDDLKNIAIVQITSGISLTTGTLGSISLGWRTVPGEATVYQPYKAQRYYIPRLKMPELIGKKPEDLYISVVKMAKNRQKEEVKMLEQLQNIVDGQMIINNDIHADVDEQIKMLENSIEHEQQQIEKIVKAIPGAARKQELQMEMEKLKNEKEEKLKILMEYDNIKVEEVVDDDEVSSTGSAQVYVSKPKSVTFD